MTNMTIMKNIKIGRVSVFLGLLVLVTLLFPGCKKNEVPAELSVSALQVTFDPEGGASEVTINCNDAWVINNTASWIQVNQTSGE